MLASLRSRGLFAAIAAYSMWGLLPVYWKQLDHVDPFEILANRIIWTSLLTLGVSAGLQRLAQVRNALLNRRQLVWSIASSALISTNGLVFIWAVANDRVTEASLGYYINPLVNVLLGFVFLKERLSRLQLVAVLIACLGVLNLGVGQGGVPWVSLVLAGCFGLYGLVRKKAPVDALVGLTVEMTLAAPVALLWLLVTPESTFGIFASGSHGDRGLLLLSGIASALPLWTFAFGARRLRYTTMGILMYISPTLQLALAVWAFGESFTATHALTFVCIWVAVAIYSVDSFRARRDPR